MGTQTCQHQLESFSQDDGLQMDFGQDYPQYWPVNDGQEFDHYHYHPSQYHRNQCFQGPHHQLSGFLLGHSESY